MCVFHLYLLHIAEVHCAKAHCQYSVNVHELLTYWSVSKKNASKNVRKINDEIIGDISKWAKKDKGEEKRTNFYWLLSLPDTYFPKHFIWISHLILIIVQWKTLSSPQSHHLSFCAIVVVTLKYSIRWHCWECSRLCLCLLYLKALVIVTGIWVVGRVANELLLKLHLMFTEKRGRNLSICLSASAALRENEREVQPMVGDSSGSHLLTEVRDFLCNVSFSS